MFGWRTQVDYAHAPQRRATPLQLQLKAHETKEMEMEYGDLALVSSAGLVRSLANPNQRL